MIHILLVALIGGSLLGLQSTLGSECRTPQNKTGNCIPIASCDKLLTVLRSGNLNVDQRAFLTSSQCGTDDEKKASSQRILVCCENSEDIGLRSDILAPKPAAGDILPEAPVCGISLGNRILGGSATQLDEFSWMALLQYKKSETDFDFHCGGSLINSRYVLTAAHCIENTAMPKHWILWAVRLGEHNTKTAPDCLEDARGKKDCATLHQDFLIEQMIKHEGYLPDSRDQFNDIGLLRLANYATPYTDFIKPICLPLASQFRNKNYLGSQMDVAGWGVTEHGTPSDVKLQINIPVWNTSDCSAKYATYGMVIDNRTQLCAGGLQGIDTCRGDSGGPLMFVERVQNYRPYFQIGIVSYGPRPCGLKTWPGVYTQVSGYIDWIRSQLKP